MPKSLARMPCVDLDTIREELQRRNGYPLLYQIPAEAIRQQWLYPHPHTQESIAHKRHPSPDYHRNPDPSNQSPDITPFRFQPSKSHTFNYPLHEVLDGDGGHHPHKE
jgi:hypothetical protein